MADAIPPGYPLPLILSVSKYSVFNDLRGCLPRKYLKNHIVTRRNQIAKGLRILCGFQAACIPRFLDFPAKTGVEMQAAPFLERFSNSRKVTKVVQGGFFLRKKPLEVSGFVLHRLENRYTGAISSHPFRAWMFFQYEPRTGNYPQNRPAQSPEGKTCPVECDALLLPDRFYGRIAVPFGALVVNFFKMNSLTRFSAARDAISTRPFSMVSAAPRLAAG
jgi:hypothetical protein